MLSLSKDPLLEEEEREKEGQQKVKEVSSSSSSSRKQRGSSRNRSCDSSLLPKAPNCFPGFPQGRKKEGSKKTFFEKK